MEEKSGNNAGGIMRFISILRTCGFIITPPKNVKVKL
jgi:hypothetical protein